MSLPDSGVRVLINQEVSWLRSQGGAPEAVISSRVRLARNLADGVFPGQSQPGELTRTRDRIVQAAAEVNFLADAVYFDLDTLGRLDKLVLQERRLISRDLLEQRLGSGLLVGMNQSLDIMINEEDHLRLQCILSGLDLIEAFRIADQVDDQLQGRLEMAYSPEWGFLTCCPSNLGTGLRASLLVHLPALARTRRAETLLNGLVSQGFMVRGFSGEGSETVGDVHQVSNRTTMGCSELEIVEAMEVLGRRLSEQEAEAREQLGGRARPRTEDSVWRAFGILSQARILSTTELMEHWSTLRLGIALGLLPEKGTAVLNRLLIASQPAHLQVMKGAELKAPARDAERARMAREAVGQMI
jgi:protein arginine kinase